MISVTINSIYQLSSLIYTQVQEAKINKVKCRKLNEQVQILVVIVKRLEKIKDHEEYVPALLQLEKCLARCLNLIKKFSKKHTLIRRFKNWIKAKKYKECFDEIRNELVSKIQVFDLALDAQQIVNREQDNVEQMAQHQEIFHAQKEEMIRINELYGQSTKIMLHQFHEHNTKLLEEKIKKEDLQPCESTNKNILEGQHELLPSINTALQKNEEDIILSRICCLDFFCLS